MDADRERFEELKRTLEASFRAMSEKCKQLMDATDAISWEITVHQWKIAHHRRRPPRQRMTGLRQRFHGESP